MLRLTAFIALSLCLGGLTISQPSQADEHRSRQVTRAFQRAHPCPSTGHATGACPGYVRDHIVPLCAGGADRIDNMQWQTVTEGRAKDRIERQMCRRKTAFISDRDP